MFWIWNDGVLRHCSNNLNRCHLQKIPLGRVDPIWATTRELSTYCEDNHSRLSQYTVDFWVSRTNHYWRVWEMVDEHSELS